MKSLKISKNCRSKKLSSWGIGSLLRALSPSPHQWAPVSGSSCRKRSPRGRSAHHGKIIIIHWTLCACDGGVVEPYISDFLWKTWWKHSKGSVMKTQYTMFVSYTAFSSRSVYSVFTASPILRFHCFFNSVLRNVVCFLKHTKKCLKKHWLPAGCGASAALFPVRNLAPEQELR